MYNWLRRHRSKLTKPHQTRGVVSCVLLFRSLWPQTSCKEEWIHNHAKKKYQKKFFGTKTKKHLTLLTDYINALTDRKFITWLCNNESTQTSMYRNEIAGHLKCTLLQLGASTDPGSHSVKGGFNCRAAGCRRSAVRDGMCTGHALEELAHMQRIPNPHTFLTNPVQTTKQITQSAPTQHDQSIVPFVGYSSSERLAANDEYPHKSDGKKPKNKQ